MTTTARRGRPTSGRFQPRVGSRGIDPVEALLADLDDLAAEFDRRAAAAGGVERSTVAIQYAETAAEVRAIVKEHQP